MNSALRRAATVAVVMLVAACAAPKEQIVLLPNPSGLETAVVVSQGDRQVVLAKPYAAARLRRGGPETFASNAQDVQARFGAALAAQPLAPVQFTLFSVDEAIYKGSMPQGNCLGTTNNPHKTIAGGLLSTETKSVSMRSGVFWAVHCWTLSLLPQLFTGKCHGVIRIPRFITRR